ncbi:hypothetical protein Rhsp01_22170 [Rhizobium sp. NBRC 114257]|uniref:Uncharacterized protein n=1 Tax=Rhizobium dioscoreae TaxID=2653122 RepID=A0ABQ0Z2C2_9HYPH|nr:hypothetical protein RsS93_22140 [Rhizobium dioscoreae]GLU81041.1 hypothetical protein Rhsp01_22170 [Rhizobium sp. NBRC 114257]
MSDRLPLEWLGAPIDANPFDLGLASAKFMAVTAAPCRSGAALLSILRDKLVTEASRERFRTRSGPIRSF